MLSAEQLSAKRRFLLLTSGACPMRNKFVKGKVGKGLALQLRLLRDETDETGQTHTRQNSNQCTDLARSVLA